MIGPDCSMHSCLNSGNKTKKLRIFGIPTKDDECSKKWCNALVQIMTKDMVVDNQLQEQTAKRSLHICELHYREDQTNCKFEIFFFIFNSDNHCCQ